MEIPVENVYYLLCYAWDKLPEKDVVNIDPTKSTDLVNLFARVLASGVDHLLKKGVDRGYLSHSEESTVLRGRIDFPKTLKRVLLQRAQAHCEFDELSYDVKHNQILKATIRRLIRTDGLDSTIRERLAFQYHYFNEVAEAELSNRSFRSVQLYRNNRFYEFLLRICELLFTNLLPTQKAGVWKFRSFLQEHQQMANLFEQFIRNFYRKELPRALQPEPCKVKRENIHWNVLCDPAAASLLPIMQTDVCITTEANKILIECKYTDDPFEQHHEGAQKLTSRHLFQISSYLNNLSDSPLNKTCRAILLYPQAKQIVHADFKRSNGQTLSVRTIDLSQNWKDIHRSLLDLIREQ
jgi:5-methylcytosine-specific restriction enzyme subunit McrC